MTWYAPLRFGETRIAKMFMIVMLEQHGDIDKIDRISY
jgi:hypothetical protein